MVGFLQATHMTADSRPYFLTGFWTVASGFCHKNLPPGLLWHGRSEPREKGKRKGMAKMEIVVSFTNESQMWDTTNYLEFYLPLRLA